MTEHTKHAHSRFGGSGASRYINCAASVALGGAVPEPPSSEFAKEGTLAHNVSAYCLCRDIRAAASLLGDWSVADKRPWQIEDKGPKVRLKLEMLDAVQLYLDAVWDEFDRHPGARLWCEVAFVLDVPSADKGEVYGTLDAMVWHATVRRLVVFDYKHGVGVAVADPTQPIFYAGGAVLSSPELNPLEIETVIVQPRDWRNDGDDEAAVRCYPIDPVELMDFIGMIDTAVSRCKQVESFGPENLRATDEWADLHGEVYPIFKTGSWCRWCPAAAICPQVEHEALAELGVTVEDLHDLGAAVLPNLKLVDTDRLGRILNALEMVDVWAKAANEMAFNLLRIGHKVPGKQLSEKLKRSKWVDSEEEVVSFLELHGVEPSQACPPKLTTITNAKTLIKMAYPEDRKAAKAAHDDLVLRYTLRESSGLTMVSSDSKREAVDAIASDFGTAVEALAT